MTKTTLRMLIAFFSVFIFAACSSDGDDIKMKTPTQQTIYADQTTVTDAIKFVASDSWKATVTPVTRASEVEWLTLSAYSGGIGENSITITLTPNTTGEDRKAQVSITTGESTITIMVEQKATKEDGTKPDSNSADGDLITKIVQHKFSTSDGASGGYDEETYEFFYDKNRRPVKIVHTEVAGIDYETFNITYGDGTVTYEITNTHNGVQNKVKPSGSIVLKNGRAVSGERIDYDEDSSGNFEQCVDTYTLSYDNDGYLVKSTVKEDGEDSNDETITWVNGNPEKVLWGHSGYQFTDKATYGNVLNNTNIDLNWFLLDSEGWDFAAGDPRKVFALIGYVGKRSVNLVDNMFDPSYPARYIYSYEYGEQDHKDMPIKVTRKGIYAYSERNCEYTIVYGN